jgi:hypothetical protein
LRTEDFIEKSREPTKKDSIRFEIPRASTVVQNAREMQFAVAD